MVREELPACEYGVPSHDGIAIGQAYDCGLPSVARWSWDDGKGWLYVCEKHDRIVEESDDEDP